MAFADDLKKALDATFPSGKIHYWDGWRKEWYRGSWAGPGGKPVALILHHTAGAATASTNPDNAGNQHGANDGQIRYVARHPSYSMPCSAFSLDRDGCVTVNAALPCYHAGEGSFRGTEWSSLGVPDDSANSYCLGVEIIDKGQDTTYTAEMKKSLALLAQACADAAGWPNTTTKYLPRHKDWAPDRKVDIKYSNSAVQNWIAEYGTTGYWDGKVPDIEGIYNAEDDPGLCNPAAWRLACRLADMGHYKGAPLPQGEQGYPTKAVADWQASKGYNVQPPGTYGPKAHDQIFP